MFPLLRHFSLAALVSVVLTTVVLAVLHHQVERSQLLDMGESNHVALAQTFANALLPQFRHVAETARTLDNDRLRNHPDLAALHQRVVEATRNTRVVKVKVYALSGRTLYSTDPAQIGKDYSDNPAFISAKLGRPMSELTHRARFSAFDRERENLDVLSSYVALRAGDDGPIEGVVEVYSEVTDWIRLSDQQAKVVTVATILSLSLLYFLLYLIVRRADRIMRSQYLELQRSGAELRIAATAFEIQQAMVVTDAQGIILRVNRAFVEATGHTADEAIGQTLRLLKSGRHDESFYAEMWRATREQGSWQGEIWNRRKNGETYADWLTITAVHGPNGEVTNHVATLIDITQRKADEEKIRFLAFYDPLTQLPNRRLLQDRLQQAMVVTVRSQRHGALMFIDLDNFKDINDTLGHDVGDQLLQQVAKRLKESVRECDTVARWGGDEFIVMLENLDALRDEAVEETHAVGLKILAELSRPYMLAGQERRNTPSIGATIFGGRVPPVGELLKQADIAMYRAKLEGRNRLVVLDEPVEA
jgi:diguanylate cyclase (GGDEF)-like protein/PAS domain S-box-containing protein